jgi:acyl-homoserine-lactone acylase
MRFPALLFAALLASSAAAAPSAPDLARWQLHARNVTITRDDWGIAHVHGHTNADAVFGVEYAQAEDDFNRVEMNYVRALGRLAEAEGDSAVFQDLRMKLFVNPDTLRALYRGSPPWLQRLMDAFADGLNFYLYTHPDVKPAVIRRFEPWMALSFTEGSIGGDIERVNPIELAAFYNEQVTAPPPRTGDGPMAEPDGSNGIAIAPALARDHHTLLWINPHTSFYFRSELQMSSDEGLDAYGAVTWGQFFVYQGFNRTAGWMHTSSGVDNIDEFLESVKEKNGRWYYRRGDHEHPLRRRTVVVRSRTATGVTKRTFTVYRTHHGPIVRRIGEKWASVSLMNKPVSALIQSWSRTLAPDYAAFRKIMELHANSSNNTIFADSKGTIAYLHSNYIPRRDTSLDWTLPVDGRFPVSDYKGLLSFEESPNCVNPNNGWVYNVNNWPWTVAGANSPKREAFPRYVETGIEETPRGQHALRLLEGSHDWTMQSLAKAAFDSWLPAFERLLPVLLQAYDRLAPADSLHVKLEAPIDSLRHWDFRWRESSVPTTLAVWWGTQAVTKIAPAALAARIPAQKYLAERATPDELLGSLSAATDSLVTAFGTWRKPWGEVNRFQRLDDEILSHFDDSEPSLAVPFASGIWGSLASFGARAYPGTRKWYGSTGNSFLAAVEFGDSVRAIAVTAGGESGHPGTKHFDDQATRYIAGNLRPVYFWPSELAGHVEKTYHPGR